MQYKTHACSFWLKLVLLAIVASLKPSLVISVNVVTCRLGHVILKSSQSVFLGTYLTSFALISPIAMFQSVLSADAFEDQPMYISDPSVLRLKQGLTQIDYLLSHWEEKTTYCNFGEFQRELLLPENKQKLMKAAAETGLLDYDKSATMNIMCRRDPEMVRAMVGLRPDDNAVLVKADRLMLKPQILQLVDDDQQELYLEDVDTYSSAISAIDTLAYEARTDFRSQETATKEALAAERAVTNSNGSKDYLAQAKEQVQIARDALQRIVTKLHIKE